MAMFTQKTTIIGLALIVGSTVAVCLGKIDGSGYLAFLASSVVMIVLPENRK